MMQNIKTVLLADDDASILTVLTRAIKAQGWLVKASDTIKDIDDWIAQGLGDVVVTDVTMPSGNGLDALARWQVLRKNLPVIVMSAHNTLLNAARAQDLGAVQFLPKPFDLDELMEALKKAVSRDSFVVSEGTDEGVVRISDSLVLVGKSSAMQQVFATLAKLIGNDLTVLITGESGTGKECVARALHQLSRRKDKPFIALNMAAIPSELVEATLFGKARAVASGAAQKQVGAFEQARGGTLFLDEVGDMPMEAQTRLLHVLQEQRVMPVGVTKPVASDVRIVAATQRNLRAMVGRGEFREDLYFRLHVVPLPLPALRDRVDDIPLLAKHFMGLAKDRGLSPKQLDAQSMELLSQQPWTGNIRELEHCIYRLCALNAPSVLRATDVQAVLPVSMHAPQPASHDSLGIPQTIEDYLRVQLQRYFAAHTHGFPAPGLYDRLLLRVEKPLIEQTLRATGGNQIKAAEILGLNRNTLRKKMRELHINTKTLLMSDAA